MQADLRRRFQRQELGPGSAMEELPFIGPYLSARLSRAFLRRDGPLTLRTFANRIAPMSLNALREKLQRALQNDRGNQCDRTKVYHIADVNRMGWRSIVSLVKLMGSGGDGHALGRNRHQLSGVARASLWGKLRSNALPRPQAESFESYSHLDTSLAGCLAPGAPRICSAEP